MFWRWCRNIFSNVAKQGIILLLEPPFVFNPIRQAVERERERERESTPSRRNQSELHKFCSNCRGPPKCTGLGNSFGVMFNQTFVQKTLDFAFENLFLLSNFVKQN